MARVVLQQTQGGGEKSFLFLFGRSSFLFLLWCTGIILLYFSLSIGLTFYQRWFLQKFHYPLLVVMSHLIMKFCMIAIWRSLWQCWQRKQRIRVSWTNAIRKIAPVGIFSGLDIAFSNWGLEFIVVSLYTMTKSTTIVFILFFALIFKLEQKSFALIMIVGMISGGLFMFTYKATQFDVRGFLLVLFASFSSGLRWTLAQVVMQRSEIGLSNPIDMLYHVQLWMILPILPLFVAFEARSAITEWSALTFPHDIDDVLNMMFRITVGGVIALAMELTEYLVISQMSSLTLSVAGIFKEVCTLALAVKWNGDQISRLNGIGLLLCLGGIVCHVVHKATQKHTEGSGESGLKPLLLDEASAHFLADATTSSEDDDQREDSSTEVLFNVLHSRDR